MEPQGNTQRRCNGTGEQGPGMYYLRDHSNSQVPGPEPINNVRSAHFTRKKQTIVPPLVGLNTEQRAEQGRRSAPPGQGQDVAVGLVARRYTESN